MYNTVASLAVERDGAPISRAKKMPKWLSPSLVALSSVYQQRQSSPHRAISHFKKIKFGVKSGVKSGVIWTGLQRI